MSIPMAGSLSSTAPAVWPAIRPTALWPTPAALPRENPPGPPVQHRARDRQGRCAPLRGALRAAVTAPAPGASRTPGRDRGMVRLPIEQRDNGKGNDWGVTPLHTPGSNHERAVNSCATYVGQVDLLSTPPPPTSPGQSHMKNPVGGSPQKNPCSEQRNTPTRGPLRSGTLDPS